MRSHKATQHLFNTAVKPFGLTIHLRMVSRGQRHLTTQQLHKTGPEHASEPGIPVGYYLLGHTVLAYPIIKQQLRGSRRVNRTRARYELHQFAKPIHDGEDRIHATRCRG